MRVEKLRRGEESLQLTKGRSRETFLLIMAQMMQLNVALNSKRFAQTKKNASRQSDFNTKIRIGEKNY